MGWHHHAVREGAELSRGERNAERLASVVGSWRFIGWQAAFMAVWIGVNLCWATIGFHWDKYPFILLNLALSTQAGFTGPILQLAANRGERKMAELSSDVHRMVECLHASPATGACLCGRGNAVHVSADPL